jgi:heme exporter protein C
LTLWRHYLHAASWLWGGWFLGTALLWGWIIGWSPLDYQQGAMVRVMYVHVPSAWLALGCYACLSVMSLCYWVGRQPVWDHLARAFAPMAWLFSGLTLLTGMLWGKAMWGTYWVWDARLTSMLALWVMAGAYLLCLKGLPDNPRAALFRALLGVLGGMNIPLIKFSVDLWNSLHQPASVLRFGGSAIHPSMLWPLLISAVWLACYVVLMVWGKLVHDFVIRRYRRWLRDAA